MAQRQTVCAEEGCENTFVRLYGRGRPRMYCDLHSGSQAASRRQHRKRQEAKPKKKVKVDAPLLRVAGTPSAAPEPKRGPRPTDLNMSAAEMLRLLIEEWDWEQREQGNFWRIFQQHGYPSNAVAGATLQAPDGRMFTLTVTERRR